MPTSHPDLIPAVIHLGWTARPAHVLDVGVGHGKYGLLAREYWPTLQTLDGVEAEPRYLDRFAWLTSIYDHLAVADATDLDTQTLGRYDLILLLDVLEHLDRPDGQALLDRIPGAVLVCTPARFFQNPEALNWPTETHRSVWTVDDFAGRIRHDWSRHDTALVMLGPRETP